MKLIVALLILLALIGGIRYVNNKPNPVDQNLIAQIDGIATAEESSIINKTAERMIVAANSINSQCLRREIQIAHGTAKWGKVPEYGFYLASFGVALGGGIVATTAATSLAAGVAIVVAAGAITIGLAYCGTVFRGISERVQNTWKDSKGGEIIAPTLPLDLAQLREKSIEPTR